MYIAGFSIKNHQSPEKINYVEVESITKDGPAYHAKCPKPGTVKYSQLEYNTSA